MTISKLKTIGISALALVSFALVYPATAIDVYIYAARSHLLTDYGLDPSTVSPDRLWDFDAYVQYASQEDDDRLWFVTSRCEVRCLDAATGKTVWESVHNMWSSDVPDTRVGW